MATHLDIAKLTDQSRLTVTRKSDHLIAASRLAWSTIAQIILWWQLNNVLGSRKRQTVKFRSSSIIYPAFRVVRCPQKILNESYRPINDLYRGSIDALIVTGNEPRAARWTERNLLARDDHALPLSWARTNGQHRWSCLASPRCDSAHL
jgi:hypothetical protein